MIPNTHNVIHPGDIVKINRFDDEKWIVGCGWYSCNGNKPTNGWYLTSKELAGRIKPLNRSDLDDIYLIKPCGKMEHCGPPTPIIEDLESIDGYDENKTQTLMNDNGVIHWVNTTNS